MAVMLLLMLQYFSEKYHRRINDEADGDDDESAASFSLCMYKPKFESSVKLNGTSNKQFLIRKASLCPGQTKCALFAHLSASGHLHALVSPLVVTSDYLVGRFSALYIRLRHTYTFSVGVLKTSGANSGS